MVVMLLNGHSEIIRY